MEMEEEEKMMQMMGIASFGKKATSSKNLEEILKTTRRTESTESTDSDMTELKSNTYQPSKDSVSLKSVQEESQTGPNPEHSDRSLSSIESESDSEDESAVLQNDFDISKNPEILIPDKNMICINYGTKQVCALSLEPSATRLIAGGCEYDLSLYDFVTMDHTMQPFRTFQPEEGHQIRNLAYNSTSSEILVAASNAQPKILDRDGKSIVECIKGDQYLVDVGQAKGHVSMVYHAAWNPVDKDLFISCSQDGTVRIWHVEAADRANFKVIKIKNSRHKSLAVTHCIYTNDGHEIFASAIDGSIRTWDTRKSTLNHTAILPNAHVENETISCLCIDREDRYLASRALDDTLKLWDLRKFTQPLFVASDIVNYYDSTKCYFTPDNKMIMTGTSIDKKNTTGHLLFYRVCDLGLCRDIKIEQSGVVCPIWSPKLNQLFVGCSDGKIRVYFDPDKSSGGVKYCMTKVKTRVIDPGESLIQPEVLVPSNRINEITIGTIRRLKSKARVDPVTAHIPEAPCYGPGQGGRITTGMSLSSFVMKQIVMRNTHDDDADPREAILKYAKAAEEDPYFVAPAYKTTQPKQIYQKYNEDDESNKNNESSKRTFFSRSEKFDDKDSTKKKRI